MSVQQIRFKELPFSIKWLDTALDMEKKKYKKCPVLPDLVPEYVAAQVWGYVITGYSLVEQSLKLLLAVRQKQVPKTHSLSKLFDLLDDQDKLDLREYYTDYRETDGGNTGNFPIHKLDEYLIKLDGDENSQGFPMGSIDWRYYPIEKNYSSSMPLVCVDYLHEICYGSIVIVRHAYSGNSSPSLYTRSWRLHRKRMKKYHAWITVRMNSSGWKKDEDRLEIFWGPDYRERYDFCVFNNGNSKHYFCEIPSSSVLPIIDKRKEIEEFNIQEGYQSIGMYLS